MPRNSKYNYQSTQAGYQSTQAGCFLGTVSYIHMNEFARAAVAVFTACS